MCTHVLVHCMCDSHNDGFRIHVSKGTDLWEKHKNTLIKCHKMLIYIYIYINSDQNKIKANYTMFLLTGYGQKNSMEIKFGPGTRISIHL